jgi:hypothetical protein
VWVVLSVVVVVVAGVHEMTLCGMWHPQVSGWSGARALHCETTGEVVQYRGMMDCFYRTVKEEGAQALFKASNSSLG